MSSDRPPALVLCLVLAAACSADRRSQGAADGKAPDKAPPPAEAREATASAAPRPSAAARTSLVPAGKALRDPAWFRPSIFEGAKVQKTGRTKADAQGLFASQLLLELPVGTDVDACVETLRKAIAPHVPNLARDDKAGAGPGRVTLRGSTKFYEATVVCGEAEGTVRAFLNYRWTRLPDGTQTGPGAPPDGPSSGPAPEVR